MGTPPGAVAFQTGGSQGFDADAGPAAVKETAMRGLLAPLSPHEEITLRRIALGFGVRERLSPRYVERLEQLQLVEETDGLLRATEAGRQRYAALERPTRWADDEAGAKEVSRLLTAGRASMDKS